MYRSWHTKPPKYPMYNALTKRNNIALNHAESLSHDLSRIIASIDAGINPYHSISTISRAILLDLKPSDRDLWPKLGSKVNKTSILTKSHQIDHARATIRLISVRLREVLKTRQIQARALQGPPL